MLSKGLSHTATHPADEGQTVQVGKPPGHLTLLHPQGSPGRVLYNSPEKLMKIPPLIPRKIHTGS